ncbi:scopoletin glucosyltransferase-like [Phalaenopsis equestris]|uniref:scopoletin glucosyltransferase-like n=1 Tax=Phalaenopsis equestris TaxID=78828 RepID=UPI0009E53CF4|nr:scopoletin glucosyltransferase-like [Phalaenopsis equestris]
MTSLPISCNSKQITMGSKDDQNLKMLFFPIMAQGHMLPMVDMAKVFALRGAAVTVVTIPGSATLIRPTIDLFNSTASSPIHLRLISFPSAAELSGNISSLPPLVQLLVFARDAALLSEPFDHVLKEIHPDCVISDIFLPWTNDVAAENGIPRISFIGSNFFALCAGDSIERHRVLESLPPKEETFVIPSLPHRIEMLRSQVRDPSKQNPSMTPFMEVIKRAKMVDSKDYGMLVNSFYELEPDYVEHYRKVLGKKAWHVGPVSLCNQEGSDKLIRGGGSKGGEECLKWLDGRKPGSVVYVCFGSAGDFTTAQLREMAVGLEASGSPFVWVVRNAGEEWIPEGYKQRIEGRGLIIEGWVPQLLILNHVAVGSFVTHCGWNSSLEGIAAGLPMGTWPLYAEQFLNERLLVDVLKIGVEVGSKVHDFASEERPVVEAGSLETAVKRLMGEGEEAEGRRRRVRELKEMGRKAVEEGGSSYNDVGNLMRELMERKARV